MIAIGSDIEASIMITLLVKEMRVRLIVAKANDLMHAKLLSKIGANYVVQPEKDMGERIAFYINFQGFVDYMPISKDLYLLELRAPKMFIGQRLDQIRMRDRFLMSLATIKRNEQMLVPTLSTEVINENDVLFLFVNKKTIDKLRFLNEP